MTAKQDTSLQRALPSSEDGERAILGGILIDNGLMAQAAESLEAHELYSPLNRRVYGAMLSLFAGGKPIDPILIGEELKKDGPIENMGGVAAIAMLMRDVPHATNIGNFIAAVKDKATARQLIRICNDIQAEALSEEVPLGRLLDNAEQAIFALASGRDGIKEARHISETAHEVLTIKREQMDKGVEVGGFPTGLTDLDKKIGGFKPGDLVIVAARPSMGKSALVQQVLFGGATPEGGEVALFFSCEMDTALVTARVICQNSGGNLWQFVHNKVRPDDWDMLVRTTKPFPDRHFLIDDTPAISVTQVIARSRRIKAKYKRLDVIGIDYLQLMSGSGRNENRQQEVSKISRDLKAAARLLECPVIALSQLSRAPETRSNPEPQISDLRESGSIEQDADTVLLLFRPAYYERDKDKKANLGGISKIIIAKQRNGPTDTVEINWVKESAKFTNIANPGGYER